MSNFWRSFGQSLDLKPAANTISQFLLDNAKKEKQQKYNDQQNQILQDLLRGTVEDNPPQLSQQEPGVFNDTLNNLTIPINTENRRITQDRAFTPEEKIGLISGLSDKNLGRYTRVNKILNPKKEKVDYKTYGKKVFKKNPDGSIDFTNPTYEIPKEPDAVTTSKVVQANTLKEFKDYPNDYKVETRTKVKNGKVIDYNIDRPYKRTKTNNNKDEIFTEEYTKELGADFGNFQKAKNNYDLFNQGIYTPDVQGIIDKVRKIHEYDNITKEDILTKVQKRLKQTNDAQQKTYLNKIERDMPVTAKKWEKENLSPNDNELTKWANIVDAFTHKEISHLDFQFLQRKFEAEYGYDPAKSLGVKLNGR